MARRITNWVGFRAGDRHHLHDLDLVHAERILQPQAGEIPVHQAELELWIGEGAGRLDAGLCGKGHLTGRFEAWAPGLESPEDLSEGQARWRAVRRHLGHHNWDKESERGQDRCGGSRGWRHGRQT